MYKTMEQIDKDYNGNWVYMLNCTETEGHSIGGGEVVAFDKNMKVVLDKMDDFNEYLTQESVECFRFAGEPPERLQLL